MHFLWAWWLYGGVGAFGGEGCWFEFHSSRHVGTSGKSFTRSCLYDVMCCPRGCLVVSVDSCNSLLPSVHTLLVNIQQYVRLYLYIKRNIIIIIIVLCIAGAALHFEG